MQDYEKLGVFYLGKQVDPVSQKLTDEMLLYDSRDLTTHAVCVGMTGSGKTGLGIALLEEAAIDGIPAIAIDPKGDLSNLLLTFPDLQVSDFRRWVDEGEAARKGMSADQYAAQTAELWRNGLKEWGQDSSRIQRLREAVDMALYTPGSTAGLPVSILRSFAAPSPQLLSDPALLRERILGAVSGLLGLLGIDADPIRSREHILLSNILDQEWRVGRSLDIPALIQQIQKPPFEKVGVFDLESFYPARERFELAILINNLIASPGFAAWMEGEPLDIQRFLYTPSGKPRLSIFSIAHLGDTERMFFMTLLLNEMLSWVRRQEGTSSLRAVLYIDEIFGYFPPTANPPSKLPMLTLLKQARAFGVGIVLATQNPVDLDYKGLANTGTWLIGRLQTERDRDRLLDGLMSLDPGSGEGYDRNALSQLITGLGKRVFYMKNIHENQPVVFQSRWALSYLRGPLTLLQIQSLQATGPSREATEIPATAGMAPAATAVTESVPPAQKPLLPPEIEEYFLHQVAGPPAGIPQMYRPCFFAGSRLHFVDSAGNLDSWQTRYVIAPFIEEGDDVWWEKSRFYDPSELVVEKTGRPDLPYAPLPPEAGQPKKYQGWKKILESYLYQHAGFELYFSAQLKKSSQPGESEGDFRTRLAQVLREQRDQQVGKLRQKYAPKIAALNDKIRLAQERVDREKSQMTQQSMQTAISVGATLLGAFLGRKVVSSGNVGRATTAMRGAGRVAREKQDIQRAQENLAVNQQKLADLQREFETEVSKLQQDPAFSQLEIEKRQINPRKSDIIIEKIGLAWVR